MATSIRFLGAAETVTGSRSLVETAAARVLVDCGLFQGWKKLRQRNWAQLPFDLKALDAVLLTHAHIDHAGYLPRLCKLGFKGSVYCTPGTSDLLRILLPDAGHLQEEDARRANKYGYTRHHPAEPLYTEEDAVRCLSQVVTRRVGEAFEPARGLVATFTRAGHIVGAACLRLQIGRTSVTFSGDVGRPADPVMKAPAVLAATDYLVVESTYGDRRHSVVDTAEVLARVVDEAVAKQGVIVVPSFAVGRAQHLLHVIAQLRAAGRIRSIPVYLDSPMAIDATNVLCDPGQDRRITEAECRELSRVATFSRTQEDSMAIDRQAGPMIIIAGSGMATGGRVLHHLRRFLPDERNTVLLVGYQVGGTRGRSLVDGADELKLFGEYVPVKASVVQLEGLSAHADYAELIEWLRAAKLSPRRVFVNHGEPSAADALRRRLRDTFGWDVVVPEDGSTWKLA